MNTRTLLRRLSVVGGLSLLLFGCARNGAPGAGKVELTIYAATSTRDALLALEGAYEAEHGVELVFNFGSSGDLSKQIVAAARADVFLSADERELDKVEAAGLTVPGSRRVLLSNQLVVIEPADGPSLFTAPFDPEQLADARVKRLSLGQVETVPAGRYAKAWLERVGVWDRVAQRVLPGIDVRAALAAVESAGAQAGIVYRTDVARSSKARIVHAVPLDEGPKIVYPVAALAGPTHGAAALAFVAHLASEDARPIFEQFGFLVLRGEPDGHE
jgi:molybdate transport system substrate-binding protein